MPRSFDAGQPLQPFGRQHRALDVLRIAEVHHHRLAQNIESVLVGVQFVILPGCQSVVPHLVFVHCLQFSGE